jgi:hypothetical protein
MPKRVIGPFAQPHNPDFARVSRKAGEQGYEVRQLTEGVFTLRQRLTGWPRLLARIMPWRIVSFMLSVPSKRSTFGSTEIDDRRQFDASWNVARRNWNFVGRGGLARSLRLTPQSRADVKAAERTTRSAGSDPPWQLEA